MRIEGDQLRLPPASELQDGFDLFYKRRSRRKTYQYQMSDGEQFSLTVCKDQATNVCPYEPDASSIDDISPKVFHQCFYNCLAQSPYEFLLLRNVRGPNLFTSTIQLF